MPSLKYGTPDNPTKFYKCQFWADYAIILKHKRYLFQLYLHSIYNLLLKYALRRGDARYCHIILNTQISDIHFVFFRHFVSQNFSFRHVV